jgi:hypothetical protein
LAVLVEITEAQFSGMYTKRAASWLAAREFQT